MAAPAGGPSSNDSNQAYNAVPINVSPNVSPWSLLEEQPTIGLIGMGAMGKMYALALCRAGWKKIHVCDLPERCDQLVEAYRDKPIIRVMRDGLTGETTPLLERSLRDASYEVEPIKNPFVIDDLEYSPEEEAAVLWKLDRYLMPCILVTTFVLNMDRTNNSNAISDNLPDDLGFDINVVNTATATVTQVV